MLFEHFLRTLEREFESGYFPIRQMFGSFAICRDDIACVHGKPRHLCIGEPCR
jgi:hypothetical protein